MIFMTECGCSCEYPLFNLFWEDKNISDLLINGQIREKEVRVIGLEGEQLGIMAIEDAQRMADEADVDLILTVPNAKPPVCRVMELSKYLYEQKRREKEKKKNQKVVELKEIRLSPNIDTNDLNTKVSSARKFLTKGDKVKVTLRFRGREMAHMQQSKHIIDDFAEALADCSVIEKPAKVEGRSMTLVLAEKK